MTKPELRLFRMSVYLAYYEFLCFIASISMCLFWDAALGFPGDITQYAISTALPFYTPKISNSKAHLGLWSCNQEFLFQSREEIAQLLVG